MILNKRKNKLMKCYIKYRVKIFTSIFYDLFPTRMMWLSGPYLAFLLGP